MQNKWKTSFRDKWKRKIEIGKKFRESSYKKENDVYKVYWKNHEVGEYIGPGAPKQFKSFNEIQPNSTDIRFVETGIKKSTPIIKLKLFNGFSNWCACGETGLTKKKYIKHVNEIHSGIALPNSFLNRPPWIDWVFFYSDEAESFYNDIATDWINNG